MRQRANIVMTRDADNESETAGAAGLDTGDGVLDDDRAFRIDVQATGRFKKGIRCRFAREIQFRDEAPVDSRVKKVSNSSGPQDGLAVSARGPRED